MKYRLKSSLGLDDARHCKKLGSHLSLDPKALAEGETVDLNEVSVEYLTSPKQRGLVALLDPASKAAKAADDETEDTEAADESPVSADNASDAIDHIGRMRSVERLQEIIDTEPRATVKKAAQDRLDELNSK